MERVTGIGGVFFKARDPAALAAWYRQHLGLESKDAIAEFEWREKEEPDRIGHTVWAAFPADTRYFGTGGAPFMINYRVRSLDRMVEQLHRAGAQVDDRIEESDYGRFAWITDPEGNRIELWEPPASYPAGR